MKRLLTYGLIILALGCEQVINIDIDKNVEYLVVEGWITDQQGPQVIYISRSSGFTDQKPIQRIDDARVSVLDQSGTSYEYELHESGVYFSDSSFSGILLHSRRTNWDSMNLMIMH